MKVFMASDHHFFHRKIIKYADRPFDIMDENCVIDNAKLMIERHNEVVTDDDVIIFGGDISAALRGREEHLKALLKVLKGKKILVRGNHDHQSDQFYYDCGFIAVVDYLVVDRFFFCHYPCYQPRSKKESELTKILKETSCDVIFHGHIHNKAPFCDDGYKRINFSVDYTINDFYPRNITNPSISSFFEDFIEKNS